MAKDEIKVPKFDLDRLAKEIDELFQNTLGDKTLLFDNEISKTMNEWRVEMETSIKEYNKAAKNAAKNMRDKIMEGISKGRVTLVLPDQKEVVVEHMDHPKMEDVVSSMTMHGKVMMVGPAGTGKTYMVSEIADRLDIPFYKYSCSRDSSVHDLLGYKQPKSEEYLNTSFLQAYENGGVFLVDEYDAMSGDMALFFNGIADNSGFISIPHRDENPTAQRHENFYLVMCGNTWGNGSTDYSGRDFQDMALMDRFRFCRHHIGYHFDLEKSWMGDNYDEMMKLRRSLEQLGSYLSTRNVEDISKLLASDIKWNTIIEMISQDLSETDVSTLQNNMFGNPLDNNGVRKQRIDIDFDGNTPVWESSGLDRPTSLVLSTRGNVTTI